MLRYLIVASLVFITPSFAEPDEETPATDPPAPALSITRDGVVVAPVIGADPIIKGKNLYLRIVPPNGFDGSIYTGALNGKVFITGPIVVSGVPAPNLCMVIPDVNFPAGPPYTPKDVPLPTTENSAEGLYRVFWYPRGDPEAYKPCIEFWILHAPYVPPNQ